MKQSEGDFSSALPANGGGVQIVNRKPLGFYPNRFGCYIEIDYLLSHSTSVWAAAEKSSVKSVPGLCLEYIFIWKGAFFDQHPACAIIHLKKRTERRKVLMLNVNNSRKAFYLDAYVLTLTSAFIFEVWEVHHLLWEDKETQSSSCVCFVINSSRIRHDLFAFIHDHSETYTYMNDY